MLETRRKTVKAGEVVVAREECYKDGKLWDIKIELTVDNNKVRFPPEDWPQISNAIEELTGGLNFTIDEDFGRRLYQYRKGRHLTLRQLSELSGVSISHLGRIERGDRFPGGRVLARLEQALKVG